MRPSTVLFTIVCAGGASCALVLTVQQARYVPPLEAKVVSTARVGTVVTVRAEVHNTTSTTRCTQLTVAARDREGRDLAVGSTAPIGDLEPGERRQVAGQLTVSNRDFRERLQRYDAVLVGCAERVEQK